MIQRTNIASCIEREGRGRGGSRHDQNLKTNKQIKKPSHKCLFQKKKKQQTTENKTKQIKKNPQTKQTKQPKQKKKKQQKPTKFKYSAFSQIQPRSPHHLIKCTRVILSLPYMLCLQALRNYFQAIHLPVAEKYHMCS